MLLRAKTLILLCLLAALATPAAAQQPTYAKNAMVVSVHRLASEAGVEMMKAGGNAVDAAVATGFALAVVHPPAGNLGGGGFLLVRWHDGRVNFLDYREKAPKAATRDMYLDEKGNVIENLSTVGYKSIGVPGSVAGMTYAQGKWGKLPLKRVMQPAIRLAEKGFALSWDDADDFKDEDLSKYPESRRIFQRNGRYFLPGEIFRQPELARTLRRIAADPADFYRGKMAQEIASTVQKGGGLITAEDLAAYEVKEREPIRGMYRGYEVISTPPPSSGGVALMEILNILEGYDLGKLGARSADSMHLTIEAFRRAMFDRAEFLGDPDHAKVPVAQLTDHAIGGHAASGRVQPTGPAGHAEAVPRVRPHHALLDR
jgi:gamma-glutamyltranspeptidase/glutathione hydrolase